MSRPMYRHPGPAAAKLTVNVPDQPDTAPGIDMVRWLAQMRADLAETLGGIMLRSARPLPIGTAAGSSTHPLGSPGRLVGWSLRETSGSAPATVRIYDGQDTGGTLLACIQVAASPSSASCLNLWLGSGVSITNGLYLDITGTIEGSVYVGAAD